MSDNKNSSDNSPDKTFIIATYQAQWADIHHNRNQDWEIAKFVLAGFICLSGLKAFTHSTVLIMCVSGSFAVISSLGFLITIRHRKLFFEKMGAIKKLEHAMNMGSLFLFDRPKRRPILRTQTILIVAYILWTILFVAFAVAEYLQ